MRNFAAITGHGLIYTNGTKLDEYGGFARATATSRCCWRILLWLLALSRTRLTREIASTILEALGIDTDDQSMCQERARPLHMFDFDDRQDNPRKLILDQATGAVVSTSAVADYGNDHDQN